MSVIKCPHCDNFISTFSNRCPHCGNKYTICSKCGGVSVSQRSKCSKCGYRLNNANADTSNVDKKYLVGTKFAIAAFVLAVLALDIIIGETIYCSIMEKLIALSPELYVDIDISASAGIMYTIAIICASLSAVLAILGFIGHSKNVNDSIPENHVLIFSVIASVLDVASIIIAAILLP